MSFMWASESTEIRKICQTYGLYELDEPDAFCYKIVASLTQSGPQCGIVALAMCTQKPTIYTINEVMNYAKKIGVTNVGEMFSVDSMFALATKFIPECKLEIYDGTLSSEYVVSFLMNGGSMIVPYDCDWNYSPVKLNGRKSHWAVIFGVVKSCEQTFVIAKQGKSLNVQIWNLDELAASNQQLNEYENEETENGPKFIIPIDGLAGEHGLSNRALLIYPKANTVFFCSHNSQRR